MNLSVLDRLSYRYPSVLVDDVLSHEPGVSMVAVKNVTVNEKRSRMKGLRPTSQSLEKQ